MGLQPRAIVSSSIGLNFNMHWILVTKISAQKAKPYPAKLIHLKFQPLEAASRYRDPRL